MEFCPKCGCVLVEKNKNFSCPRCNYKPKTGKIKIESTEKINLKPEIGVINDNDTDVFPTYYRGNTPRKLGMLANRAGLTLSRMILHEPCPWFLSFSPVTLALGIFYERLVNFCDVLAPFRAHILAIYRKL